MLAKHADGMMWTFDNLDQFIANPKGFVPGTAMAFAGLKNPEQRADVIAYLRTLSDNPVPLPTPVAEAPAEPAAPANDKRRGYGGSGRCRGAGGHHRPGTRRCSRAGSGGHGRSGPC